MTSASMDRRRPEFVRAVRLFQQGACVLAEVEAAEAVY
jgi:hypothetical protein